MKSGICTKSNIKLIFSICKLNDLIGAIGMLVLSLHFYSVCCMSYIQMILSLRWFMVSIPLKRTCASNWNQVWSLSLLCRLGLKKGMSITLCTDCNRHCERHMWDHCGSSCWCTYGLHLLWGVQLYGFWCWRYGTTKVLTPWFAFDPSQVVSYAGF